MPRGIMEMAEMGLMSSVYNQDKSKVIFSVSYV